MSIIKWSPFFEPFEEMERTLDVLRGSSHQFVPAIDMFEDKGAIVVKTSLPDIDPKNVEVTVKDGMLTVSGSTEHQSEVDEKNYYRKEIRSGSFSRSVMLPKEVEDEKIEASYEDGVLKISAPIKKEALTKPKSIKIEVKKK